MFNGVYSGRRVLVTGHTGFKGSWLSAWLLRLGAHVSGYSDRVPTTPANFDVLGLGARVGHHLGDIRDRAHLASVIDAVEPEVVFHLAAQPLVRHSYEVPVETFEVNALGTLNVLEAVRRRSSVRALVVVTSDKAYRNVEWVWGYRETDALGGEDPYSGSKACAELITYSYIHSFFLTDPTGTAVASARAGNVIGGGDWAPDRIVPDCVRAWSAGEVVTLRNPSATRPWQHVLEPLSGYLWLGARLFDGASNVLGEAYNFGPDSAINASVGALIERIGGEWPAARAQVDAGAMRGRPEARLLRLSCDKALADLAWRATLTFDETVRFTAEWYRRYYEAGESGMAEFTDQQIDTYTARAAAHGLAWARPA